jgi:hypothetical protein
VTLDREHSLRQFQARLTIAELMPLGGQAVARVLAGLTREQVEDVAMAAIGVFVVLGDDPLAAARFWRRYAETGRVPDDPA